MRKVNEPGSGFPRGRDAKDLILGSTALGQPIKKGPQAKVEAKHAKDTSELKAEANMNTKLAEENKPEGGVCNHNDY